MQKNHGGARKGAGRPKGQGAYGEETAPVRIPVSLMHEVKEMLAAQGYRMPFYRSRIPAGNPATANDDVEEYTSANELLNIAYQTCFVVQVQGDSMIDVGIFEGDCLIADAAAEPKHNDIVIANVNGDSTVKRFYHQGDKIMLVAENSAYPPIELSGADELNISGVVVTVLRRFRK